MSKNKNQHYVPAFYLYNFTNDEQKHRSKDMPRRKTNIFNYDFRKKCLKERPIEKVAIESFLLSHKNEDGTYDHSLDYEVQTVEDRAAKAIEQFNDILKYTLAKKPRTVEITNSLIDDLIELLFWQIKRHPEIVDELTNDCDQYLVEKKISTQNSKQMALKAIKEMGKVGEYDIKEELHKKNKIILCTSTNTANFITTDKPFVRFNNLGRNGIAVQDTEIYFPITSHMLLFMCNNGSRKEFRLENDRRILRDLNTYIAKSASRYLFGPSEKYLQWIVKNIG